MSIKFILKKPIVLLLILFSFKGFSQLSKQHFIPPLTNANSNNALPDDQYIYLSTPNTSNVAYKIIPIGQPAANHITGVVSNGSPQEILIATGPGQLFIPSNITSLITNDKGYIIESEDVIYASIRMNAGSQAGALVSKGISALGTTFRVGSYTNATPSDDYLNFVSVMATENNTQVNFSDLPAGLIIENYTGTTPINIVLNKGESYTIATKSDRVVINRDGLIGCLVSSDKPIVVNCGSSNGSFGTLRPRDYGIDQIVGLNKVGTEYIVVRGDGEDEWENILIVAHTDNTTLSINGNAPITSINAGEYFVIEGNNYNANGNMYIETSEPVFTYQGVGGLDDNGIPSPANQGMFFVPPLSCETRGNLDNIANINRIGNINYTGGISIVTKVGATVNINGAPIASTPSPVTGKPDYITYKIKGLNGNITVSCDDELYCAYFNYNGAATSGGFYSGFASAPEINFNSQFAALGNCIPNVTLEAANRRIFDSYKWLFDDGSGGGFIELPNTTAELTPTRAGNYKLVGVITCTGKELESAEVPVNLCPSDRDNDGIIDNLDIDKDNDGILNCVESRGDVTMDLSNTRPPNLIFQDGTINSTIATDNITLNTAGTGTNTIQLNTTGSITSIIPATSNGENTYNLSFTEPVNINFLEDITIPSTGLDEEYFIIKIFPASKNITLIDPDGRLLVDSNFDGSYENGVTQISGSEIRFKKNTSPTGNTPYQFLADDIEGFELYHRSEDITSTSDISGIISLTCFNNDNDNDGVADSIDLDSDNDGIPDLIENQGTSVTLSLLDANNDGLDDIFNASTLPIDTDNDNTLDFYDLDSDNDGIFDLIETGQLGTLPDTNLDGLADGPNFGVNGWIDTAETTPDSNTIGYALNDLDNDSIFSYLDSDSDGDGCNDVIEAGFSDGNNDDLLGDNLATTNTFGVVNNAIDGYTIPNSNYLNVAPISITTQPADTIVCEASNSTITVVSPEADNYQWELSTDNGTTWTVITDDAVYSNSQTATLNITNTPLMLNSYNYRVLINRTGNSCGLTSDAMELNVNPIPVISTPVTLDQCDDNDPATIGFSSFNLSDANNQISANASNETFAYYLTENAAILGDINSTDFINNPTTFQNRTVNTDIVWARITSAISCAAVAQIQLNVYSTVISPTFVSTISECDDDSDGEFPFDTAQIETDILGTQNPSNFTFSYFDETGNPLPSPLPNPFLTANQTITIRLTNNNSSTAPNGPCFNETTLSFVVTPGPVANPVPDQSFCDGSAGDTENDNLYPFNTSAFTSTILGSQNMVTITYTYTDENGIVLNNQPELPNPLISENQTITATVINANNSCTATTTINLTVNTLPEFEVESPRLICFSDLDLGTSIDLEPFEADPSEFFFYEWLWTSIDGTTTNQFVSNNRVITVSQPGTYTISLTKTNNNGGCSESKTIFVDSSELANITSETVTIRDLSDNNSVTINTANLGMGEYEFALQSENSSFINYQTEPFFENVAPGFYTLHITDNVCGVASLQISVVGFPKYFTPNGDGINDFWHIAGFNNQPLANSVILIFDRYGKLIKQLKALDQGWDGTFNGANLPNNDYWFKASLEDGRNFSGHFTLKR